MTNERITPCDRIMIPVYLTYRGENGIRAVLTKLHNARWNAIWELAAAGKEGSRQDAEAQGN